MIKRPFHSENDLRFIRLALGLARRGYGHTSPNPMVGALLVKSGEIIGRGWHHASGQPHAEIEAIRDAQKRSQNTKGATLYVTLEPCCTHGRTPPCTSAIVAAQIKRVVAGSSDPNPRHAGRGFQLLRRAGIEVTHHVLEKECENLNPAFNHWIIHRTPLVTVKAAMTLDGKIADGSGNSKWITSKPARAHAMKLREGADAILVGINTVLADDPSLTVRSLRPGLKHENRKQPRRIILDAMARTPVSAKIINDEQRLLTTIVVSKLAPKEKVAALSRHVRVLVSPHVRRLRHPAHPSLDLSSLLKTLGGENVTSLLIEGGGEVNASFLFQGLTHHIAFFYAPKVLSGRDSIPAVSGEGVSSLEKALRLTDVNWVKLGPDLLLTARVLGD